MCSMHQIRKICVRNRDPYLMDQSRMDQSRIIKNVHTLYYTPFSKTAEPLYAKEVGYDDGRKIVCIRGSCDLPDTELDSDGNIILNGYRDYHNYHNYHNYPISGKVKISGEFYWKIPVYGCRYVKYEDDEMVGEVSLEEVKEWMDSSEDMDEFGDGETVAYFGVHGVHGEYVKEKYIDHWEDSEPFEYTDVPIEISRKYVGRDSNLFRYFYNIRTMEIEPVGIPIGIPIGMPKDKFQYNELALCVNNEMNYYFRDNLTLNLDDPKIVDAMGPAGAVGPVGTLLNKYPTWMFNGYELRGGCHTFYKVTVVDHKPENVTVN